MEAKEWLIVFGIAAAAFFFGRASNAPVVGAPEKADDETTDNNPVQVIGGQAYYNLNFQMSGNAFNPMATEYMPLFGFVANRIQY